jgi:hypothetical protein
LLNKVTAQVFRAQSQDFVGGGRGSWGAYFTLGSRTMISNFHPSVHVLTRRPGASQLDLQALLRRFPMLPLSFAELFAEATDLELSYKGRYLRFYGPDGCVEMDEAYQISERIPGAITVGDNGGGDAIIFRSSSQQGLYRVPYGAMADDELIYIAPSLEHLLYNADVSIESLGGVYA